jgi:hypothetical protein
MGKYDIHVNIRPVANHYATPGERIVEYSNKKGDGGLISFRENDEGDLIVELYRHDKSVTIRVGEGA